MPYSSEWVDPEVFLEHKGVRVYCTYKDNDLMQGPFSYLFSLNNLCDRESCNCEGGACTSTFDVRNLSTWCEPVHPPALLGDSDTPENKAAWNRYYSEEVEKKAVVKAIRKALDSGLLLPPIVEGTPHEE
jgi:hypothetical protein